MAKIRVQMPMGTSSISVAGQQYEPDRDGIVTVHSTEHVGPLLGHGGVELDGESGSQVLIGTEMLPAEVDVGEGRPPIALGTLVSDTHARTKISVDQWNNLPQQVRDILLGFQLAHLRGDLVPRGEADPRLAELEAANQDLTAQLEALQQTAEIPANAEERPDFANMTKARINDWLSGNGGTAMTSGGHGDFVSAAEARWSELHPASEG